MSSLVLACLKFYIIKIFYVEKHSWEICPTCENDKKLFTTSYDYLERYMRRPPYSTKLHAKDVSCT